MNCNEVRENISLYIDGKLQADQEAHQVEQHLACCSSCKTEYEALKLCILQMKAIPQLCIPDSFDERLHRRLLETKQEFLPEKQVNISKRPFGKRKLWKQISGVAAAFVIGIFSYTMYNHMDSPMVGVDSDSNVTDKVISESFSVIQEDEFTDESSERLQEENINTAPRPQSEALIASNGDSVLKSTPATDSYDSVPDGSTDTDTGSSVPADTPDTYSGAQRIGESSRHLDGASKENTKISEDFMKEHGIQNPRDMMAVSYYANSIEKELKNFDFKIEECKKEQDGSWYFRVHLNTVGEYGQPLVEELIYTGQDGKIWIKESSLLTETAY